MDISKEYVMNAKKWRVANMDYKTFHKISYGLYIVCSKNKDKINGQIINVLFQVSSDPPKIAICINKKNYTHEFINSSEISGTTMKR